MSNPGDTIKGGIVGSSQYDNNIRLREKAEERHRLVKLDFQGSFKYFNPEKFSKTFKFKDIFKPKKFFTENNLRTKHFLNQLKILKSLI